MKDIRSKCVLATVVVAGIATVIACTEAQRSEEIGVAEALATPTNIDLITTTNCITQFGKLTSCLVGDQTLSGRELDTAVPVRTTFSVNKSGNCSTQYPLEVTLETPGELPVKLRYLSEPKVIVRRRDGEPLAFVTLKDTSPWTKTATVDSNCRITLSPSFNEIDVDSKEQAQGIMDRLTKALAEKTEIRNRYGDLVQYQKAFAFLESVTTSFYTELTNDTMQQLRSDAQLARPILMKLVMDNTCGGKLTDDEFASIASLYDSMAVLGTPDAWKGPDGKPKSLADIVGADAAKVLATVQKISHEHDADAGTGYEDGYKRAALDVERAKSKVELAKVQLAPWLGT